MTKRYYKEVMQWQILMYISFIKKNEFPYQKEHFINLLKNTLIRRNKIINDLTVKKEMQLSLF
jgi:hypothetical protein